MAWTPRARRERRLLAAEAFRQARRMAREDVTVFGEQLADLHLETLTTELDDDLRADYRAALDAYDVARGELARAATEDDVSAVARRLDDGRFRLACVLARRDGTPLPTRREPCFFNPQHGPAVTDVAWTPPGGVEREVPVCRNDQLRLTQGLGPDIRLVQVADQMVPWWGARDQVSVRSQRNQMLRRHAGAYTQLQADLAIQSRNGPDLSDRM